MAQMVSLLLSFSAQRPEDSLLRLKVSHKAVLQFSHGLGVSCIQNHSAQFFTVLWPVIELPDVALTFNLQTSLCETEPCGCQIPG